MSAQQTPAQAQAQAPKAPDPALAKVLADPKTQMEIAQERAALDADKQTLQWAKNMQTWMQSDPQAANAEFARVMSTMHPAQRQAAQNAMAQTAPDSDDVSTLRSEVEQIKQRDAQREHAQQVAAVNKLVDDTLAEHEVFKRGSDTFDEAAWKFARQNLLAEGVSNPQTAFDRRAAELARMFIGAKAQQATGERNIRADQQQNMATLPPGQGAPQVTVPAKATMKDWEPGGKREEQLRQQFARGGTAAIFGRNFGGR